VPALGARVTVVVGVGPEKEVAWIDAEPVVAAVTSEHPRRDRAVRKLERNAVGLSLDAADADAPISDPAR